MEKREIDVNGQVFPCPINWTVTEAKLEIRDRFGLKHGGLEAGGLSIAGSDIVGNHQDIRFVDGIPADRGNKESKQFIPVPPLLSIAVDTIPDKLLTMYDLRGSVHASSVLNGGDDNERSVILQWIQTQIVCPTEFTFTHPEAPAVTASRNFNAYAETFTDRNLKLWNVENFPTAGCKIKFHERPPNAHRFIDLSGRPDFIVTPMVDNAGAPVSKADFLAHAWGVIEIQSKHRDQDILLCEVQLQLYLMLMMNTWSLPAAIGFLVQDDGMCRTYRATRDESIVYEHNELIHVSCIAKVLHMLYLELDI